MAQRRCFYINPSQDISEHGGYVPSLVDENEPGHAPLSGDPEKGTRAWVWGQTLAEAERIADEMNQRDFGLTHADMLDIVTSSMAAGR